MEALVVARLCVVRQNLLSPARVGCCKILIEFAVAALHTHIWRRMSVLYRAGRRRMRAAQIARGSHSKHRARPARRLGDIGRTACFGLLAHRGRCSNKARTVLRSRSCALQSNRGSLQKVEQEAKAARWDSWVQQVLRATPEAPFGLQSTLFDHTLRWSMRLAERTPHICWGGRSLSPEWAQPLSRSTKLWSDTGPV